MSTYIPKIAESDRKWFLIDARGQVLGKLAATAAADPDGQEQARPTRRSSTPATTSS